MTLLRFLAFNWIGRAIVGLVVIAAVGATVVAPRLSQAAPTAMRTATVTRGNVTQTISVSGSISASSLAKAAFRPTGRIAEILVKVGDTVTVGQPLARLETTDLATAVKQAEANVLAAQAKYDSTAQGATAEDLALAKNALDSATLSYEQTKRNLATDVTNAQTALDKARRALSDAKVTTTHDLATAQQVLDKAKRGLADAKATTANDLAAAQQSVDKAKRALADAMVSTSNDVATAQQALDRTRTAYTTARASFATLTSAIVADLSEYRDALATARAQLIAVAASVPTTATEQQNALASADLSLANAQQTTSVSLTDALTAYRSAVARITDAANSFESLAPGSDLTRVAAQYQLAQADFTLAAPRLSAGLDAPSALVTSAQTSVTSVQNWANSYAGLQDDARSAARQNILIVQRTLAAEVQLASAIRTKITQANTNQSVIAESVGGSYASAQAAYATAQTKARTTVQSAQDAVASSEHTLIAAQSKAQSTVQSAQDAVTSAEQALLATQTKSGTTVRSAEDAVTSAEQALALAQDKQSSTLASSEITLSNARVNYSKSTATPKSTDIALAQSSLQLAQIALDKARTDLENATLRAAVAGVISTLTNQVGETPTNPFAVIAVTGVLTLHGTIGESEVAKVRVGQVATLAVDAVGSATRLTGKVTSVDPVATLQQGVPVYGVDITIDRPDPAVRPGMTASATVIVQSKQSVLTVPNSAIRSVGGRRTVQILENGAAVDAGELVFGIANDTVTEVVRGLEEGQTVVLPAPRTTTTAGQGQGPGAGQVIRGAGGAAVPGGAVPIGR